MSRFLDANSNVIDTTGQNQPPMNAATMGFADPTAVPTASGTAIQTTWITAAGCSWLACIKNPA